MDAASSASACLVTSAAPSRSSRLAATQETSAEIAEIAESSVSPASAARAALDRDATLQTTFLTGGDDYEIAFCAPHTTVDIVQAAAKESGVPVTAIGVVEDGVGVLVYDGRGSEIRLDRTGFTHG